MSEHFFFFFKKNETSAHVAPTATFSVVSDLIVTRKIHCKFRTKIMGVDGIVECYFNCGNSNLVILLLKNTQILIF